MGETLNRLNAVESNAARLRDRRIVLLQKKKETEKFIEVHEGLLSPIHLLLPEILQEIFWRCLPTTHNSVLSVREAPLVFGQVCSQWRRIAYSTPKLWSSLHIAIAPLDLRGRVRLEAIDVWLTRSGILPLSLSMCTYNGSDDTTSCSYPLYFNLILKYAKRWKRVHLEVDPCDPMDFLAEITVDDFPLLEVFHLRREIFEARGSRVDSLCKKDGILFTPSLCALSMDDISVRLPDLPIQFAQLTGLGLGAPFLDIPDIFKVLGLCSNLETLVVIMGLPGPPTSISQSSGSWPLIVLTRLRTLKVYGQFSNLFIILTLLDNLSTPALRHFAYQAPRPSLISRSAESWASFRAFFQRLNEPLQELDLLADVLDTSYVMEFLYLFPELKRLLLRYSPHILAAPPEWALNEQLLLRFIPWEHRTFCQSCPHLELQDWILPPFDRLCPNLEVLDINRINVSKHILLEHLHSCLVNYNKYSISRLRRFNISFSLMQEDEVTVEEVERLSEESGVQMKFQCFPPAPAQPEP